ncbi:cell wall metabolism sensor histidine kinase WalK [cf. Phormidesmis sp. LEGE 11477]|uniref:sensor histidine kinase n=1 Tax=cf. Phormidesmis sp. LEGE 11477 TaxID=1828680 RepID=UPI00187E834C|nr:HAMP domain-containing sensor histidine kinase [cf. Phormidesmis sp. LEGE 11477]MBE9060441.1 sensor histidine kinase [cf. Phormidesmis sp. LEGE 11477]
MEALKAKLLDKVDDIIERWTREVRRDIRQSYNVTMTYESIHSRLPLMIEAISACLANESAKGPIHELQLESWERLQIPVELGFDIREMDREFNILRMLLLSSLQFDFRSENVSDAVVALRSIDSVLERISGSAAERYTQYQLERLEPMHQKLLTSNQELVRLVQMQKDNASYLAHELKNPLNSVISFSTLLLRARKQTSSTSKVPAKELKHLERIYENGIQMLQLVNNMLEVSRKNSQQHSIKVGQFEVAKLVERVVESQRPAALKKGLSLTVDCRSAPPLVSTDMLRLQQVIVNLISNAIRYTDSGSIQVSCAGLEHDRWLLSVQDTGRGISPAQQENIFKPYLRDSEAVSHPTDSTGLGLAIVSKLVVLLQGELKLTSIVGKGSTFSIILPLDTGEDYSQTS